MPKFVRNMGNTIGQANRPNAKRNVLYAANGNVLVVLLDPNDPTGSGDDTGVAKFYIYESSDRISFTLRATITPTVAPLKGTLNDSPGYYFTADLFSDNSVGIAWIGTGGVLRYRKATYGTWSVAAEEQIAAAVGGTAKQLDLDMSVNDQGAVLIGNVYSTTTNGSYYQWRLFLRTTAAVWGQCGSTTVVQASNPIIALTHDVSVVWIGGASASARTFALSYSSTIVNADAGTRVWVGKISETTVGAITGLTQVGAALQVGAIEALNSSFNSWQVRRSYLFKDENTNSVTVGVLANRINIIMTTMRFTYDGTTVSTVIAPTDRTHSASPSVTSGTITYGPGALNFVLMTYYPKYSGYFVSNFVSRIDATGVSVDVKKHQWDDMSFSGYEAVYGGTGRNSQLAGQTEHDSAFLLKVTNAPAYSVQHEWSGSNVSFTVTALAPAAGAQTDDPMPTLKAKYNIDTWPKSLWRMRWQFARDNVFSTGLITYDSPVWGLWGYEDDADSSITDELPAVYALAGGTWYNRVAMVDEFGTVFAYTSARTLTELHIPSAFNPEPQGAEVVIYPASGNINFTWQFSDSWDQDHQTAYQIVCEREDTGATVFDTGKVVNTGQQHTQNISGTLTEVTLRWRVRVWDVDDNASAYTDNELFVVAVAPTVSLSNPTEGAVLATHTPAVQFTPDTAGGRNIYRYRVRITQGLTAIHDSGWVYGSWADLTLITYSPGQAYLKLLNSQQYTVQVIVEDSFGLQGNSYVHFSTSWVTPAVPTVQVVSSTNYNVVGAGYNRVTWSDAARDTNFQQWNIYRRDDFIDPNTQAVLQTGTWTLIGYTTDAIPAGYTFDDYYAPSGYKTLYQVTQVANNAGLEAESTMGAGSALFPASDGYWIIDPNASTVAETAYKLAIVTGDSFTNEMEEETFNILNRGRYVEKGTRFGFTGSLTAQVRDDPVMSARQRIVKLKALRETNGLLYLRNPFGDTFRIAVGSVQIDRIAGVGKSEFVDVTIPYQEVSS